MAQEIELTRRERKKGETKHRIFQAAIKLFRDKGFEVTTIDDITERADVAKGTFFNYFPRKEAVLGYLAEVWLTELEEHADAIVAERKSARAKVIEMVAGLAAEYAADRELSQFIMLESMRHAFRPAHDVRQRWRELMRRVLEQGQAAGELRRALDVERALMVIASVYLSTLMMWIGCPEGEFDLQDEMRQRLDLVFDGLTARGAP